MKNQSQFDQQLKKVIDRGMNDIDVPNMDDVWINIENHIKRRHEKKKLAMIRHISIAVVILFIIGAGYSIGQNGYASYIRTLKLLKKDTAHSTEIQIDNKTPGENGKDNLSPSQSDVNDGMSEYIVTVDTAKEISGFPIQEPSYIPDNYTADKAFLEFYEGQTLACTITYISGDQKFEFIQEPITNQKSISIKINPDKGTFLEKFEEGYQYNIIQYISGKTEIIWDRNEIQYTLIGTLSEEEMMKIAVSVNKKQCTVRDH